MISKHSQLRAILEETHVIQSSLLLTLLAYNELALAICIDDNDKKYQITPTIMPNNNQHDGESQLIKIPYIHKLIL